jgi:16S rRNA (uracil1498-N3)-methyltransferase
MHRFFVPPSWIQPPLVHFEGDTARQISRVLRLVAGVIVTVLDGGLIERHVRLTIIDREHVTGEIIAEFPTTGEPRHHLTLYVGLTQRAKFEWILQKGTELGVSAFVPVITSRSLVRETAGDMRKTERWEAILREAAEQCGRGHVPKIQPPVQMIRALADGGKSHLLCLIAWEQATCGSLKDLLSRININQPVSIGALIGPEGGFAESEVQKAIDQGWQPVSLGRRILRMETAAVTLAALILYELGEFKPPDGAATGS